MLMARAARRASGAMESRGGAATTGGASVADFTFDAGDLFTLDFVAVAFVVLGFDALDFDALGFDALDLVAPCFDGDFGGDFGGDADVPGRCASAGGATTASAIRSVTASSGVEDAPRDAR